MKIKGVCPSWNFSVAGKFFTKFFSLFFPKRKFHVHYTLKNAYGGVGMTNEQEAQINFSYVR